MKNFKKLIASVLSVTLLLGSVWNYSYAAVDTSSTYYEERDLLEKNFAYKECAYCGWYCEKYLFRYEEAKNMYEQMKNLSKNAKARIDAKKTFWYPLLQKIAIGSVGLLGVIASFKYISAAILLLGMVAFAAYKCAESEDFKKDLLKNGALEKIRECILGDKIFVHISAEEKQNFYQTVLNKFIEKIKNKEWEGNDICVLSTNLEPNKLEFGLRFKTTAFKKDYEKPLEEYFKDIIEEVEKK